MATTYSAGGTRTTAVVIAIIVLHLGFYWALKQGLVRAGMGGPLAFRRRLVG